MYSYNIINIYIESSTNDLIIAQVNPAYEDPRQYQTIVLNQNTVYGLVIRNNNNTIPDCLTII